MSDITRRHFVRVGGLSGAAAVLAACASAAAPAQPAAPAAPEMAAWEKEWEQLVEAGIPGFHDVLDELVQQRGLHPLSPYVTTAPSLGEQPMEEGLAVAFLQFDGTWRAELAAWEPRRPDKGLCRAW